MKFLEINPQMTLSGLADIVGKSNVEDVLHLNGLERTPNIGQQYDKNCAAITAKHVSALEDPQPVSMLSAIAAVISVAINFFLINPPNKRRA